VLLKGATAALSRSHSDWMLEICVRASAVIVAALLIRFAAVTDAA
jgi:hypothetical protein